MNILDEIDKMVNNFFNKQDFQSFLCHGTFMYCDCFPGSIYDHIQQITSSMIGFYDVKNNINTFYTFYSIYVVNKNHIKYLWINFFKYKSLFDE